MFSYLGVESFIRILYLIASSWNAITSYLAFCELERKGAQNSTQLSAPFYTQKTSKQHLKWIHQSLFDLIVVPNDERTAWLAEKMPLVWNVWYMHGRHHHLKYNKNEIKSHFALMGSMKNARFSCDGGTSENNSMFYSSFSIAWQFHTVSICASIKHESLFANLIPL